MLCKTHVHGLNRGLVCYTDPHCTGIIRYLDRDCVDNFNLGAFINDVMLVGAGGVSDCVTSFMNDILPEQENCRDPPLR